MWRVPVVFAGHEYKPMHETCVLDPKHIFIVIEPIIYTVQILGNFTFTGNSNVNACVTPGSNLYICIFISFKSVKGQKNYFGF